MHEHGDGGNELGKLPGSFKAIHHRHNQIENDEVGLEFLSLGDGFLPVSDFCDFPGSGTQENAAQCGPNRGIVLGNEN